MSILKSIAIGIVAAMIVTGCASTGPSSGSEEQFSGFLGDYSKLEPIRGEGGEELRRWITSKNIKGKYPRLLVDPVVFHPEPQATGQISLETLYGLRRYTDEALRRELSKSYLLVDRVGPGVARVRLAMTGVATEAEGLAAYEYLPFTAIAAGISTAAGTRDRVAFVLVEGEVTDSLSGEKLGMAVRKIPGDKLLAGEKEQLTVEMMRIVLDEKARNARLIFDRVLK